MSENQNPLPPQQQHVDQSAIKSPSPPPPPSSSQSAEPKTPDYAPYPKLDPKDIAPPSENWADVSMTAGGSVAAPPPPPPPSTASQSATPGPTPIISGDAATTMPAESNPYVSPAPASKNKMDAMKDVLGKWGKKAAEATKKAEDLAGNVWQHLKTGPSFADAAVGRIAQSTKVLAEGGYEKVFKQTFEGLPDEQLIKTYACYLSTSAGPVMGTLYLSTAKLAFCSDNPLSYQVGDQTQWSYYKVVIPLHQLKAVNPSISKINSSEKYIQIISIDNHEFWLMGFVNYESAVKNLQGAVPHPI